MRLYAYERNRLSVSAFGKFKNCKAAYILSTHYQAADGLESAALLNGLKVHSEFESADAIHGFKVLEHEKKIEIEGPDTGNWMGYIDAICDDGDSGRFVVDIKTSSRPATKSWARGYLTSLQGMLYTIAERVETFAIYHPTDEKLFFTSLNPSVSRHMLLKAFREFSAWQNGGQSYDCSPSWSCRFCEFQGHCEWLMTNPGCKLPPTLQTKKSGR